MKPAKITVVGAGNVGASLAQRLIEKDIADVVMLDIIEGLPQGKALDIQQSAPAVGFVRYIKGTNNYEDTAASDVVVITSGIARKPGMSREDLIKINAGIVSGVVKNVTRYSPDCIIIMVANPVDAMTYLTVQVSGLPRERVIGLSGVLDSARLATFIALEMRVTVKEVTCYVLGEHGQNMVVLPRLARVNGKSITELLPGETINRLIDRTVNGGAEIVELLKTSSAFYAPSASIAKMVLSIVEDKQEVMPCSVCLNGEYGLRDVAIGVPVRLGRKGIMEIVDLGLTDDENRQLADSAGSVSKQISSLASIKGD
jgi:malate dehydrogenase